jgi:hypothetical protein
MKKQILTSILALLVTMVSTTRAQDRQEEYLGLPGDNLNLYAVMNLFQESETLETFERNLNDQNSRVNNLDLNGDNLVDYLMVTDYVDNDVHNIVLQVALSQNEKQDVAVFTVERFRNGSVQIQLIGDEALYGRNYIIEPNYDDNVGQTPNPGYNGRARNRNNVTIVRTTTFEIAAWPVIRFIYRPDYRIWHSSWNWGYYPSYWSPWSPYYYHYYYGYHYNYYPVYYSYYRHWNVPRYTRYNDFYYSRLRAHSPQVSVRISNGNYKTTYSRPESRRDGEALYSKTRSSTNIGRRTAVGTTTGNSRRSTGVNSTQSRTNSSAVQSNGTSRRSTNTVGTDRTNRTTEQSTGTSRRSETSVNNRAVSNPSSGQQSTTTRRSVSTVNERNNTRSSTTPESSTIQTQSSRSQSAGQNTNTSVRSRSTATNPGTSSGQSVSTARRSSTTAVSRPQTNQRAESGTTTKASSGSNRKAERAAKTETTVKRNETSKSETSTRRK